MKSELIEENPGEEDEAPAAIPKSAATEKRATEEERGRSTRVERKSWEDNIGRSVVDGRTREERRGRSETRIEERFPWPRKGLGPVTRREKKERKLEKERRKDKTRHKEAQRKKKRKGREEKKNWQKEKRWH